MSVYYSMIKREKRTFIQVTYIYLCGVNDQQVCVVDVVFAILYNRLQYETTGITTSMYFFVDFKDMHVDDIYINDLTTHVSSMVRQKGM